MVESGEQERETRVRQRKRKRKKRNRREITDTQCKTRGGETVPCRRTPPFFLKRGLPDHNGGLQRKEEEGMEGVRERKRKLVNHLIMLQQPTSSAGFITRQIARQEFEPISQCF